MKTQLSSGTSPLLWPYIEETSCFENADSKGKGWTQGLNSPLASKALTRYFDFLKLADMVRDKLIHISLRIAIVNSAFLALRSQSPNTHGVTHLHVRFPDSAMSASSLALTPTSSIFQTSPGGAFAHIPESSILEGGPEDSELPKYEQVVDDAFSVMKNASGMDVSPLPVNLIQVQDRNSSCGSPGATSEHMHFTPENVM